MDFGEVEVVVLSQLLLHLGINFLVPGYPDSILGGFFLRLLDRSISFFYEFGTQGVCSPLALLSGAVDLKAVFGIMEATQRGFHRVQADIILHRVLTVQKELAQCPSAQYCLSNIRFSGRDGSLSVLARHPVKKRLIVLYSLPVH
jgi:hypothetical protein